VKSRPGAVAALVSRRDQPFASSDLLVRFPGVIHLDPVDPPAPRIPRDELRFVVSMTDGELVKLPGSERAHALQVGSHGLERVRRNVAGQKRLQQPIICVLVFGERRRLL
jgi:hypothetical protein